MKQNITLSLDKELIRKARVLAAQQNISISRMLSMELQKIIQNNEEYERAKKSALANLRTSFHLGGKIRVTREELHER
ncbi:MAG: hypothetical protein JRF36_02790 [Deltaproteobacteria bacterium]|jgi:hypothetical protein|nr:hypothetical protein [Deltaproteobacteria bacterium]MBW2487769.1 hypothetical protein [Deltaproteobacteria bacterium]